MTELRAKPTFFPTPGQFRLWLDQHHDKNKELWVGFHKKSSGKPSITWPEAVREALCYGWIDGQRRALDDVSYTIRFIPRRKDSTWSTVNVNQVNELIKLGLMRPFGLKVFQERDQKKSGTYAYEQRKKLRLDGTYEARLRANKKAWEFFQTRPPSYQRPAIWWVMSAKQEETRLRRLARLIEDSEHGRTIPPLTRPTKP